ncbi:hypothetical protein [Phaeovulum sp.]
MTSIDAASAGGVVAANWVQLTMHGGQAYEGAREGAGGAKA